MALKLSGGNELVDAFHLLERGGIGVGMTVAALGCGSSGHFVFPAAYLVGPSGKVYAVDILKSVLSAIESHSRLQGVANVVPLWADLERPGAMKIPEGSVDMVLLCNTLSQLRERDVALREAVRIMRQGGHLIVADWKTAGAPFGPPLARRLDRDRMRSIVHSAGFEEKDAFDAGPYHYGMVFRKP